MVCAFLAKRLVALARGTDAPMLDGGSAVEVINSLQITAFLQH